MRSSAAALVLLLLAGTALADGDPREEAKSEFEAGQRADAARDYLTAVEAYERANQLLPHPFTMFNIAVDHERLGHCTLAAEWYETYLRAETDTSDRDRVHAKLAELRGRPAPLSIRTLPPGARATIDGHDAGSTPITMKIPGGPHKITVVLDGQREARDVNAECGEPIDAVFSLRGQEGTLDVNGTPDGSLVSVDDVPLGRAPAKLVVAPGPHHVVVSQAGYASFDTQVTVRPDSVAPLSFTLARQAATEVSTSSDFSAPAALGWYIGSIAGEDARGKAGFFVEGEIGAFHNAWGGAIRVGETGGHGSFALLARWEPQFRVRPFVTFGYSYVGSAAGVGFGIELAGGLAATVVKTKSVDYVIKAEAAIRSYLDDGATAGGTTSNSYIAPLGLMLEVVMKRTPPAPATVTPSYPGPAYQ